MPALVKSRVGSLAGTSDDECTRLWPLLSKKRRNVSRISEPVGISYLFNHDLPRINADQEDLPLIYADDTDLTVQKSVSSVRISDEIFSPIPEARPAFFRRADAGADETQTVPHPGLRCRRCDSRLQCRVRERFSRRRSGSSRAIRCRRPSLP